MLQQRNTQPLHVQEQSFELKWSPKPAGPDSNMAFAYRCSKGGTTDHSRPDVPLAIAPSLAKKMQSRRDNIKANFKDDLV